MANTIIEKGNFYSLEDIDSDWSALAEVTNWEAVKFFPGAIDDILVIKEEDASGPVIAKLISHDGEGRIDREMSSASRPFLDFSDCTLTAGSIVTFIKKITS